MLSLLPTASVLVDHSVLFLLTVSFNRCEGNTIFTFLIQVFLKIDQHQMLMGFCLIEMKNIAVVELLLPPTVATKVWTGAYTSAIAI
jgi:hypothetical protein